MSVWRELVEQPVDDRFTRLLIQLGLEHRISWSTAGHMLNLYEAWQPPAGLPRLPTTPWSNPLGDTPRDLAAWIALGETLASHPLPDMYPHFWAGAAPMEAWHFDLDPQRNPGDHVGVPALQRTELSRQLELAGTLQPRTKWLDARTRALLEEAEYREASK